MLKGYCHEIFDFWFFPWISFPQASEFTITAISIFFENSRRYSRLKVHQRHRWQMEKIFKLKNCYNSFWAPLGSRVNIYLNFCLQVHFKVSPAWYCSHYLPTLSRAVSSAPSYSCVTSTTFGLQHLYSRSYSLTIQRDWERGKTCANSLNTSIWNCKK